MPAEEKERLKQSKHLHFFYSPWPARAGFFFPVKVAVGTGRTPDEIAGARRTLEETPLDLRTWRRTCGTVGYPFSVIR